MMSLGTERGWKEWLIACMPAAADGGRCIREEKGAQSKERTDDGQGKENSLALSILELLAILLIYLSIASLNCMH